MEIKFKKSLLDYDYLVMFDLASKVTGACVWDIKNGRPVLTRAIRVTGACELPFAELKREIDSFFKVVREKIGGGRFFVSKEMMPTQIHGGSSTVQTFLALAKSHAVLDVYCYERGIDCYDYKGVAPATTHAHYRRLTGLGPKEKVTKEMVRDYLRSEFADGPDGGWGSTLDETDAVFLAQTLCEAKWDNDIRERIREEKRHKKELKAPHAIAAVDAEIERLESLKNEK